MRSQRGESNPFIENTKSPCATEPLARSSTPFTFFGVLSRGEDVDKFLFWLILLVFDFCSVMFYICSVCELLSHQNKKKFSITL